MKALNQRSFHVFLSHSSADKGRFANGLHDWLSRSCGLRVWYDPDLPAGQIAMKLNEGIENCRAAILVLSRSALQSGWVEAEYGRMQSEAADAPGFRIVPIRIDDVEPFGLLKGAKYIDAPGGDMSIHNSCLVIESLLGGPEPGEGIPVFASRGWRPPDRDAVEQVCEALGGHGLRLFGDCPDQPSFDEVRIGALMEAASGYVAILPHRGDGKTSSAILREHRLACALGLPTLVFRESEVDASGPAAAAALALPDGPNRRHRLADLYDQEIAEFVAAMSKPRRGRHIFIGHSLETSVDGMFAAAQRMLSRLCGLPVRSGGLVAGFEPQRDIISLIQNAECCIIDITNTTHAGLDEKIDYALNSCIEAGIALGAGTPLYLTRRGPRRTPPFMFRNIQVWPYEDGRGLAGVLRRISENHRRLVL